MKKSFLIIGLISIVVIGIIVFLSLGNTNTNTVVVGVHSWPGGGIVYVGQEKGFFKEEGIEVVVKKIENFDTKRAALVSGQIDVDVANTLDQLLIYNDNNFPAQIIGITDQSDGGDGLVVLDSIENIHQLEGKTIAYAEASPSDFFLRYILKVNNVNTATIKFKPVADPQIAGNAIIAKQVDAAVTYEPWLSQSAKEKDLKILVSTREYPTLIPGLLIANSDKVNNDEELYRKFLRAWFKSADYYYANREISEKIIANSMGMSIDEVKEILDVVDIQTKEHNRKLINKSNPDNLYTILTNINVFWKESGFINKNLDSEKMINIKLIQE